MLAGYYCFVAGAILSPLPRQREGKAAALAAFGETVPCKEAGRRRGAPDRRKPRREKTEDSHDRPPGDAGDGAGAGGRAAARASRQMPEPGTGQILILLRPAPSAAPTCTSSTATAAARSCRSSPATRSSARWSARGRGCRAASPSAIASACRGSVWTCGPAASAARAARTSATRPLHRLPARRRLRRAHASPTQRFCFRAPRRLRDVAGRAAAVRRADRLPRAAHGRRRASASASTASARRRTSSRRSRAIRAGEVFAFTRPGDAAAQDFARDSARPGPAARTSAPPEPLDAAHHLRPGRRAGAARAARRRARAASWSAAAST